MQVVFSFLTSFTLHKLLKNSPVLLVTVQRQTFRFFQNWLVFSVEQMLEKKSDIKKKRKEKKRTGGHIRNILRD